MSILIHDALETLKRLLNHIQVHIVVILSTDICNSTKAPYRSNTAEFRVSPLALIQSYTVIY